MSKLIKREIWFFLFFLPFFCSFLIIIVIRKYPQVSSNVSTYTQMTATSTERQCKHKSAQIGKLQRPIFFAHKDKIVFNLAWWCGYSEIVAPRSLQPAFHLSGFLAEQWPNYSTWLSLNAKIAAIVYIPLASRRICLCTQGMEAIDLIMLKDFQSFISPACHSSEGISGLLDPL